MIHRMRDETPEQVQPLRSGYTTGACATATSLAAARLLLTGESTQRVSIDLPRGQRVAFELTACARSGDTARADTIKDAGDDPDATHGATVFAEVCLSRRPGVWFSAASGVGIVTRVGLSIPIGEPAINPVPRKMMAEHLQKLANHCAYHGGFEVAIGMVNGEKIAANTMNGRLGIVGGVSILGTTGIVRPFSCAAYIASIHQGIDVARANGIQHIAACTGSSSEQVAKTQLTLSEMALIEMGDFAGAVLKYMRQHPVKRLSIVGGFGKLSKLADGHLDLHSRQSSVDFAQLACYVPADNAALIAKIAVSNTTAEVLDHCQSAGVDIGEKVCQQARCIAKKYLPEGMYIDVIAIDRSQHIVGRAA